MGVQLLPRLLFSPPSANCNRIKHDQHTIRLLPRGSPAGDAAAVRVRVAAGAAVDVAVWFSGQLLKLDDLRWGIFGGMCTLPSTHRGMGLVLSLRWFVEHGAGRRLRFDCRVLWS